ncbi:MAG: hypothetical protein ACK4WD_07225 [Flavobacteriales bacterium]
MEEGLTLFDQNLPGISHAELFELTFLQIQKDFIPYVQVERPEQTLDGETLYLLVKNTITQVLSEQPQNFVPILYRIDLSEKDIKKDQRNISPAEMVSFISQKILRKEAQKVWLRKSLS